MIPDVSAIEQWNIDQRIVHAREDSKCREGETILQVIQGGITDDWQEAYASICKETRVAKPATSTEGIPDPDPIAST